MILAKCGDAPEYRGIHPNLDKALERITPEFLSTVGYERVEIEGTQVYATRFTYETIPDNEAFFEAHRQYLDVHLMLEGSERIEIAPPDSLTEFERSEATDVYAYRGEGRYSLILSPGDFLVVFPGDAHKIKMQVDGPCSVTKAVFKVKIH